MIRTLHLHHVNLLITGISATLFNNLYDFVIDYEPNKRHNIYIYESDGDI